MRAFEETFCLPTVEAMACGVPAIVYDCTALPEVISAESGKIVEANNVELVWKEIKNIFKNPYNSEQIIKNAKHYEKMINIKSTYFYMKKLLTKKSVRN